MSDDIYFDTRKQVCDADHHADIHERPADVQYVTRPCAPQLPCDDPGGNMVTGETFKIAQMLNKRTALTRLVPFS